MTGSTCGPAGRSSPGTPPFDVTVPARRVDPLVVAVVALGGMIGAGARYAATLAWPTTPATFPWTILLVNVIGCTVIGAVTALLEQWPTRRWVRPLLGTGVLGGFTTFSAYALDVTQLMATGHYPTALGYLIATPVAALLATGLAARFTVHLLSGRPR